MRSTPIDRESSESVWLTCRHVWSFPTFMSHAHLRLHCLEIIRETGLGLSAHAFSSPLLESADPLVHVHVGGWDDDGMWKDNRNQRLCREQ
jgi:hypothetical protein